MDKDKEIQDLKVRIIYLEAQLRSQLRWLDDQEGIDLRTKQYQAILTRIKKHDILRTLEGKYGYVD